MTKERKLVIKTAIAVLCYVILCLWIIWAFLHSEYARAQGVSGIADTLDMGSFSVAYRHDLRIPISADWVCAACFLSNTKREQSWRFAEDTRVLRPRATHSDYTRAGYDRGHLCPAADRSRSAADMRSTFIMTNVAPQAPTLNRGEWKKLETACRNIARHGQPLSIHVDVIFWKADTQRIGRNAVAVPHGFIKTIRDCATDTICYSRYFQNW